METEGNLLQKMKNVFSDNEDKEKIAEEIIEKVLEGYEKGVLTRRDILQMIQYMYKMRGRKLSPAKIQSAFLNIWIRMQKIS